MNLLQVRESEQLRFQNPDVRTVFDVSRNIFKKNYGKIEDIYREQEIDSELGLVIGTITESKELINHALERKGGRINMCTALEELKNDEHCGYFGGETHTRCPAASFLFICQSDTSKTVFLPK